MTDSSNSSTPSDGHGVSLSQIPTTVENSFDMMDAPDKDHLYGMWRDKRRAENQEALDKRKQDREFALDLARMSVDMPPKDETDEPMNLNANRTITNHNYPPLPVNAADIAKQLADMLPKQTTPTATPPIPPANQGNSLLKTIAGLVIGGTIASIPGAGIGLYALNTLKDIQQTQQTSNNTDVHTHVEKEQLKLYVRDSAGNIREVIPNRLPQNLKAKPNTSDDKAPSFKGPK